MITVLSHNANIESAIIGKWQMGAHIDNHPLNRG